MGDGWYRPNAWICDVSHLKAAAQCTLLTGHDSMMYPGLPHAVFTLEPAICSGGHFYLWATMEKTFFAMVHALLMPSYLLNADHAISREVLIRYMHYLHCEMIINGKSRAGMSQLPSLFPDVDI